jgi:uncharacterized membrane protein YkgB
MPLSEQEQRLLDEMERNLYQNDADFVATVGGARGRANYRGIILGAILVVVGIGVLLAGVGSSLLFVGVLGFLVMFAGVILALTPARTPKAGARPATKASAQAGARKSGSFMDNLNERWEKRQEDRDR